MTSCVDFSHPIFIFIFIFICSFGFVGSQPLANCSLDLSFSGPSGCEGRDWGGFLRHKCCDSVFEKYVYGLGLRAKETGRIYLNFTEQMDCLVSMKTIFRDVMSCGIERLTSGAAGCSHFSVSDVSNNLGDRLADFKESCLFAGSGSCDSCLKSWRGIRATSADSEEDENDICRFAVLVSLTSSRVDDEGYVKSLYSCLAAQESNTDEANRAEDDKRKPKIGTVTWILIGCLSGFSGIIVIAAFIYGRKCFRQKKQPPKRHVLNSVLVKERRCRKISTREVYAATNNLHAFNLIGEGTAGKVYKGVLWNNQHVAIKHIVNNDEGDVESFAREVTSLSHVRHPNLVTLLGCCVDRDDCFLVYELCPNGNLSQWIFGKDKVLSWTQRLHIAIGSGRGLCFLHTFPEGCIVHRDVKPTNILLAANFEAKVSDFGLSKVIDLGQTYASSEVRGTFGYMDPDYQNNNHVKSSGDVYSFGIVLLQILSGKKVINLNVRTPIRLNKMAKALTREGSTAGFADPKLEGEYPTEAFELVLELALSCTTLKQQRPSMEQVVARLEEALNLSTSAKASTSEITPNHPTP